MYNLKIVKDYLGFYTKNPKNENQFTLLNEFGTEMNNELSSFDKPVLFNKKKECYRNAYLHSAHNKDLIYCEGLAVSKNLPLPLEHAWCLDNEGRVYDPTWDDSTECLYFGIAFRDKEWLNNLLINQECYGVLSSLWVHSAEKRVEIIKQIKENL